MSLEKLISEINELDEKRSLIDHQILKEIKPVIEEHLEKNEIHEAKVFLSTIPSCPARMKMAGFIALKESE